MNERGTREYKQNCAFCRQPTQEEGSYIKQVKRLTKKNHPVALMVMAVRYLSGDGVIQSDTKTFEMLICAAELGHAPAFGMIAHLYEEDNTVFSQNISKTLAFGEIGAKKGDVKAHIIIATQRFEAGDYDNSIKHLKVAANAGHQGAMDLLMEHYKNSLLPKEDLAQTLRAYQASSDQMKSPEREKCMSLLEFMEAYEGRN